MNYKDIEKEFDAKRGTFITESGTKIEGLTVVPLVQAINVSKAVCLKVIDDMIGEEKKLCDEISCMHSHARAGYNQKVSELRAYKKKFNK